MTHQNNNSNIKKKIKINKLEVFFLNASKENKHI